MDQSIPYCADKIQASYFYCVNLYILLVWIDYVSDMYLKLGIQICSVWASAARWTMQVDPSLTVSGNNQGIYFVGPYPLISDPCIKRVGPYQYGGIYQDRGRK